ncbi:segregation and condensation protein B [Lactobacillus nasalidis]|uniref:Segregation and condensation protein B n=1 Tax=Lactobacillus nasalidis TaxID=2797258 RepID=A0ABQ3W562_9LACO|nr:SMC-Scp complex subunit ScpB [Lactobacillus nasalidis]GHV96965.1 segregation and condensation protein B [Lactobacillus nasalidis]GHV99901.1 segregation and condensation protein B [Lactobacillus nasalidis]GHW00434.1 segregation and condensation protein B [Lactobacillus nasalidis]
MTSKIAQLEALLYVAGDSGIKFSQLQELLQVGEAELKQAGQQLQAKLAADPDSGLQLLEINDEYKLTTAGEVSDLVEAYFNKDLTKTISQSALEILAIVAYRQPITRIEIDEIRGVNSSGALQTLVWRGLVKSQGVKEAPGHPKLYVTTDYFLQYFGYKSLADLPVIENFEDSSFDADGQVNLFAENGTADEALQKMEDL